MPWREKTMITAMAVGFLPLTKLFSPQADSLSITDTFRLKRILPDSMMVLSYVFFEGNTDQILPESAPALQALLKFLNDNPTVKIEIQGHVNAPGRKNSRSLRKLSEARAYAIKKFLTFNDVRKNRIRTEGFGNERMLFPDPQTPTESEQNRRVEVKIISVGD
jgi:outer membrane protein OmpA-like peptidoglycan-associated protein